MSTDCLCYSCRKLWLGLYDFKVADLGDVLMLLICSIAVLRHKATSLLSQCESLWFWRNADMCMAYLLAVDTTAERSGERERRAAASLKPNSCVCVTSESHLESRRAVRAQTHLMYWHLKISPALASRVILSQDVKSWLEVQTHTAAPAAAASPDGDTGCERFWNTEHRKRQISHASWQIQGLTCCCLPARSISCQHLLAEILQCSSPQPEARNVCL